MKNFTYRRAETHESAINLIDGNRAAKFLGGGTNLVDLMRENIEQPEMLIDVTHLSDEIEEIENGNLKIGAAVKNTALANHEAVRRRFPVLSQAILYGASGQIRNMATVGGNLLQRTRCYYFYDTEANCNKRENGTGCDAIEGFNRIHAILGTSENCIATHPSDMCVALAALEAIVHVEGAAGGTRTIPLTDFHRLPGDNPEQETNLGPFELITAIEIPAADFAVNSIYRKVRDRASYAFALVSVAAALEIENDSIRNVRIALGGVAHKPWRATEIEKVLQNAEGTEENFMQAAETELKSARGFAHNSFKIELAKRTIVSVLNELMEKGGYR